MTLEKVKFSYYVFECKLVLNGIKPSQTTIRGDVMKKEYDLSQMKSRKNPYAKHLKKQVTMRLGTDVIEYFKDMAKTTGVPYQNLINLYLKDCASSHRELKMQWR